MESEELKNAVRALLFVHGEPCGMDGLVSAFGGAATEDEVRAAADELVAETASAALVVQPVAGGWQMKTHPRYAPYIHLLMKKENEKRLSTAALEVLSVIAFKQPVTRDDVESLRGVDCFGVIQTLLDHGLVDIVGKKSPTGAHLYGTTKRFLVFMGLDSLADLPRPEEVDFQALSPALPQDPKAKKPLGPSTQKPV